MAPYPWPAPFLRQLAEKGRQRFQAQIHLHPGEGGEPADSIKGIEPVPLGIQRVLEGLNGRTCIASQRCNRIHRDFQAPPGGLKRFFVFLLQAIQVAQSVQDRAAVGVGLQIRLVDPDRVKSPFGAYVERRQGNNRTRVVISRLDRRKIVAFDFVLRLISGIMDEAPRQVAFRQISGLDLAGLFKRFLPAASHNPRRAKVILHQRGPRGQVIRIQPDRFLKRLERAPGVSGFPENIGFLRLHAIHLSQPVLVIRRCGIGLNGLLEPIECRPGVTLPGIDAAQQITDLGAVCPGLPEQFPQTVFGGGISAVDECRQRRSNPRWRCRNGRCCEQ